MRRGVSRPGAALPAPAIVLTAMVALTACGIARPAPATRAQPLGPRTRAERTAYRETSSWADVAGFIDSLRTAGAAVQVDTIGHSPGGRPLQLVIASRPLVRTPAEARRSGKAIVYVQGNIHAGEVEGKEALQALLRDLTLAAAPNVLDSIVLLAVPVYNADGNERLGPQARNRGEQNGPDLVGERANGQGLDLNRDYMKAEAPETRASLALFAAWDPDVFVDLHTTDGSFHGYALTYAPSLVPAAEHPPVNGGAWARDSLLPELRHRMRARHGIETFSYGNFSTEYGADVTPDTTKQGWFSYDHRPRFGTNYYGLRGRVAILSEAYSHDPFERRVASTRAFVAELLSLVAERSGTIRARSVSADSAVSAWGGAPAGVEIPIRAELTRTPFTAPVIAEDLERLPDSTATSETGVPAGLRRTGRLRTLALPVHDRFTATRTARLPHGYAIDARDSAVVLLLRAHGVRVERLERPREVDAERFSADSTIVAAVPFQGHRLVRVEGQWHHGRAVLAPGTFVVPTGQPLGVLVAYLLEPESDDGVVAWGLVAPDAVRRF